MFNSFKKTIKDILTKGLYDVIKWLLIALIASVTGQLYNFFGLHGKYLVPFTVMITLISVIAISLLILIYYRENNPIFNIYKKTDFQYIFLEKEIIYDYTNLDNIKYEKNVKLKVICDSVDRFYDKYSWTGDSKPLITSSNKLHVISPTPKRDSYEAFEVLFGRTYKKGEIIDLKLTFIAQDKDRKSNTRISTTIDDPIRNLKIKIKVSQDFREGPAMAIIFPMIDGRNSIFSEEKNFDNDGAIEWSTKDPQMLTKYSLIWNPPK